MKKTRSAFRQQKKQARLSFEPLASSSPAKSAYSPAVRDRLANVRVQGTRLPPRTLDANSAKNESEFLPTPEPSSQPQPAFGRHSSPLSNLPSSLDQRKSSRPSEEAPTDEDDIIVPSSKRRKVTRASNTETPTRRSTRFKKVDTPQSSISLRSSRKSILVASSPPTTKALSIGSAETSGDEEETLHTKPTAPRRGSQRARSDDPFVVSDDEVDNTNGQHRNTARSKKNDTANDFVVNDDEIEFISSDEDQVITVKPRGWTKNRRRNRSQEEQEELVDELQDLQDSDDSEVIEENRQTRGGPVNTQRDRNREQFELLRRRRAGEPIPRIADSDDDDDDRDLDEDDGADLDQIANDPSEPRGWSSRQLENSNPDEDGEREAQATDEEDDGFIVDDDESQPSRVATIGIPLAFTSFASSKPKELFVHVVEWLIKNKIAPAFARDDELYALSWNKINDQIKAQAGSRLISAAWNEDFKNAVLARPQMQVHLVTEGHDEFFLNCDACNRTKHLARYEFRFTGQAYHKDTLEPIDEDKDLDDEDEDEDEDEADDGASYDQQGHLLPSAHRSYNLGRFCAANAEMGHKLTHWKYHLNQNLLEYLEEQGVLSAEAIVAREKLNKKKREKEAENIVDQMQETGIIDQMWRGLQSDLEDARFGMEDHVAEGGKRNQKRIGKVRVDRGNGRIEEWSEGGRMHLVVPDESEGE